jgi:hypothetical protein
MMSLGCIAAVLDSCNNVDDEIARIDTEREKLQKHLAIDLFVEAITEAEDVELSRLVDAYKTGDTLRLGNLVRDMVGEYLDRVAKYRATGTPS